MTVRRRRRGRVRPRSHARRVRVSLRAAIRAYKLTASIAAEYANADDFDVRFAHCVTGMTQTPDGVEIAFTSQDGEGRLPPPM